MELDPQRIPIIKLWNLLLVPLQGEVSDNVADELRHDVLDRIHREACSGLVIDITGLWAVDSHLCSLLSRISTAASFMGVKTFISGMKPEIALTLQTMGIPLTGVRTTLDLERALELLGASGPPEDDAWGPEADALEPGEAPVTVEMATAQAGADRSEP